MQCPRCQSDVMEGHFYCANCHALVQAYEPEAEISPRGRIERAGARFLNALVFLSIIATLLVIARMTVWTELIAAIRGEAEISEKAETDSKARRDSRQKSDNAPLDGKKAKATNKALKSTKGEKNSGEEKKDAVETQPTPAKKDEKLPPVQDKPQTQKPVEKVVAKNSDESGLVINTSTPAMIYINGQFSGNTPRTIKLSDGDYQIRLIADGYEEWRRRVRVKDQRRVEISPSLKKKNSQ